MIMAMISACHDFTLSWKVRIFKNTKICFPAELLIVNKGIISSTKGDMSGKETLIIYYDESECSACVINHLAESVNKYKTISKSNGCNVVILFSPLPENAQEVLINLIDAHLNFPIYIDQYGEFRSIIGKTNRDEIQNQMRLKFARKLQKRNVTEKSRTSYSQKWLSNVN